MRTGCGCAPVLRDRRHVLIDGAVVDGITRRATRRDGGRDARDMVVRVRRTADDEEHDRTVLIP